MRLNRREKLGVIGAGVVVAGALVYVAAVAPVLGRLSELDARIARRQVELGQLAALRAQYAQLKAQVDQVEARIAEARGTFSILSFLEGQAVRLGIRDRIASMRPQTTPLFDRYRETAVEVRLERVSLNQLVNYLYQLEATPQRLVIKRLNIRTRFDNPAQLDVTFQVATYELA